LLKILFVITAITACAPVAAFEMCVEDQPLIPLSNAGKQPQGVAEILVKEAARNLGIPVTETIAPWIRCNRMLAAGDYDAALNMTFAGKNPAIAIFPMTPAGAPDTDKAIGRYTSKLFRRVGSTADMVDGIFVNTPKPVGIQAGYQLHRQLIQKAGWTVLEIPNDANQMAEMLAGGRVDLLVGDYAVQRVVETKYKGVIEPLPTLFSDSVVYVAFSKKFYQANRDTVERLWAEIARVRNSREYQDEIAAIHFAE
jgi:polar amino acid transport system substrate-binding protein